MHRDASRGGDRREEMKQEMAGKVHPVEAGVMGRAVQERNGRGMGMACRLRGMRGW